MSTCSDSAFETYLLVECHLAKNTIQAYASDIQHFKSVVPHTGAPKKSDIIAFLATLNNNEYTKSSMVRKVSSLRMYCFYLKHKRHLDVPNLDDVFSVNRALVLPKLLSQASLDAVLDHAFVWSTSPQRDACLVGLLYYCGCRVSEVVGLSSNHVFSDHIRVTGKGGRERMVPLAAPMKQRLDAHLGTQKTASAWVFPGRGATHISRQTVTRVLRQLATHEGIAERLTPHTLRHMFATQLLARGMDIREVQLMLGHVSITTTQIYTHVNKTGLRHVYNAHHPLS